MPGENTGGGGPGEACGGTGGRTSRSERIRLEEGSGFGEERQRRMALVEEASGVAAGGGDLA